MIQNILVYTHIHQIPKIVLIMCVHRDILVYIITQTEMMKYKIILNKNRKDILTLEKQLLN